MNRPAILSKAASAARDLADALAELARASDAEGGVPGTYDSTHRPPRTSRRRFAELCRSGRVAGAYREGREWVCTREAWHASRARAQGPRAGSNAAPPSLVDRADELLRRHTLRLLDQRRGR
jgi:hypothetical protein